MRNMVEDHQGVASIVSTSVPHSFCRVVDVSAIQSNNAFAPDSVRCWHPLPTQNMTKKNKNVAR